MEPRPIVAGDRVRIVKGCAARTIAAGKIYTVSTVEELGADYSHSVKVVLSSALRSVALYARHRNRLSDPEINLNDGNPLHTVRIALVPDA